MTESKKLFTEFSPVSKADFEAQIVKDLKGKDYDQTLIQQNPENIRIEPFYVADDIKTFEHVNSIPGQYPYLRGVKNESNWEIRQDIKVADVNSANNKGLDALMKGATSLGFDILNSPDSDNLIKEITTDILLEHLSLNFISGNKSESILNALIVEVKNRGLEKNKVKGSLDFDPLGNIISKGNWYQNEKADFEICSSMINHAADHLPFFRVINISGNNYHNAGSSIVQEVAFSLAQGNEYLHKLTESGHKIDDITAHIQFSFSIGSNYLMEIAKLRALRMLWARIIEQYNPKHSCSMATFIHCETSAWNQTIYDPWVNMLRGTTEAMSSIIGGADSLTVLPYDNAFKNPDEFSERIARNTQLVLQEEAYLNKVADPAGGSYHIEILTDSIAKAAWDLFQETEGKGGFLAAIKEGFIQKEIEQVAEIKKEAIKSGKEILLGTNKHPNPKEKMAEKMEKIFNQDVSKETIIKPLKIFRAAEDLERLRLDEERKVTI